MFDRLNNLRASRYKEATAVREGLAALQRQIFSPKVAVIGWDKKEGESHLDALKRVLVLNAAMQADDKA
jgi:hypothetical protein